MARCYAGLALAALLCSSVQAADPDLSRVDRGVAREPDYRGSPRYCLLVFGPGADTRVWLVEDGETLYVDRNANGDITEAGESVAPSERRELKIIRDGKVVLYRQRAHSLDVLSPADGSGPHTEFRLSRYRIGDEPAKYVLSVRVDGTILQYAGWRPLFADSREKAAVVHFGGPVVPQPIRRKALSLTGPDQELHVRFVTPGSGKDSLASLGYQAVPEDVDPVAEIEWPADEPAAGPVRTTVTLTERC